MAAAEVLIIGAGPAGSAAAIHLARAGFAVTLVDRERFPRDKVCGDALIPDAMAVLERLGLLERTLAAARPLPRIRVYAPNRRQVEVAGRMACLPRRTLDALLCGAAVEAGATLLAPARLLRLVEEGGTVRGAVLGGRESVAARRPSPAPPGGGAQAAQSRGEPESQSAEDGERIYAPLTLLATGAASAPLELAGLCLRKAPSGFAVRRYYRHPRLAREMDHLCISFDRGILPGYGWIFPGPGAMFNVGAGCFLDGRNSARNVREMFDAFVGAFPPARQLAAEGEPVGELRGAPLRTALRGARLWRPGLMAIGEAAGTTYSFSGEGIGKAMESGLLAAELAAGWIRQGATGEGPGAAYERELRDRFGARFRAYEVAQRWLSHPAVCDFIAARARNGGFVRAQLSAMLAERGDPRQLFSLRGFARALLG
jgi:flavin-dependent dehydrogenase